MITRKDISKTEIRKLFFYDFELGRLRWRIRPSNRVKIGDLAGSINNRRDGKRIKVKINDILYLHAPLVWVFHNGKIPKGMYVDHKFGNTMDDRIESLQLLSQGDNTRRSLKCQGKVPYRGIDEHRNAFQTRLGVEGERFYLGRYKSDLEAAAAYEYAAEFATNGIWVKPEYYNQLPTPPHKMFETKGWKRLLQIRLSGWKT